MGCQSVLDALHLTILFIPLHTEYLTFWYILYFLVTVYFRDLYCLKLDLNQTKIDRTCKQIFCYVQQNFWTYPFLRICIRIFSNIAMSFKKCRILCWSQISWNGYRKICMQTLSFYVFHFLSIIFLWAFLKPLQRIWIPHQILCFSYLFLIYYDFYVVILALFAIFKCEWSTFQNVCWK